jgi:hypothetical protein
MTPAQFIIAALEKIQLYEDRIESVREVLREMEALCLKTPEDPRMSFAGTSFAMGVQDQLRLLLTGYTASKQTGPLSPDGLKADLSWLEYEAGGSVEETQEANGLAMLKVLCGGDRNQ